MNKKALISVSDKTGVVEFAKQLEKLHIDIISTGGTLKTLLDADVKAKSVEEITKFPEMLDGRVKTLHPNVHGGILANRSDESHVQTLEEAGIGFIDFVIVNLYPFKETILKENVTDKDIIENIDIGGPTMLRAAAKNFQDVTVIVNPEDYEKTIELLSKEELDVDFRQQLAGKVFQHTANYDAMIANYFTDNETFPDELTITYEKKQSLRYGENPHQRAVFYENVLDHSASLTKAEQLHGKEMSYNNIQDANAALEIVLEYEEPATVAVKHMNPCGIGLGENLEIAFQRAYDADPISIFGGIIAVNREVDEATAKLMNDIFLEVVIAPNYTKEALEILASKENIRLLKLENMDQKQVMKKFVSVKGGLLAQTEDDGEVGGNDLTVVTEKQPTEKQIADLLFSWKAVKHVKSNAIVLAENKQTIGVGAGQMNRIGAANIAIKQAGEQAKGAVLASDAFFPMPDTVEAAAKAGITAIIQPGGSKRDQDSIDVCNEHGIVMVYTNMRHFKH